MICGANVISVRHDNVSCAFTLTYSSSSTSSTSSSSADSNSKRASTELDCDSLIMATGSSRLIFAYYSPVGYIIVVDRIGYGMLASLGHTIAPPLPSLFSFKVNDSRLLELAGVSAEDCSAQLVIPPAFAKGPFKALVRNNLLPQFTQRGPILCTHQGRGYTPLNLLNDC